MNEQIRLLQTEIRADLESIAQAYDALGRLADLDKSEMAIAAAYYLHVIYGLFENLFRRVAALFGNHVTERDRWHAQLLRRMTLDVPGVRPPIVSQELYESLDELRRFRHLFRNAYVLNFDPDRLAIVLKHARRIEPVYQRDIQRFLAFLDILADTSD
jgi:hypothetical protein